MMQGTILCRGMMGGCGKVIASMSDIHYHSVTNITGNQD
jgi:hypothetical protein